MEAGLSTKDEGYWTHAPIAFAVHAVLDRDFGLSRSFAKDEVNELVDF